MNKIRILSDLHLEFGPITLPPSEDESNTICILAGDIGLAHKTKAYMDFLAELNTRFKHTIYIMGNHEHYKGKFPLTYGVLQSNCEELHNVSVLEKESIVIDDIAFICATLWTDMDNGNPTTIWEVQATMSDFSIIRTGPPSDPWRRKLRPIDVMADFTLSKRFIFDEIVRQKDLGNKVVVVTHHAPSHESADPEYRRSRTAGAYATDLQQDIIDTAPDAWIHGHMHSSSDYTIDKTRVVCNPRGYTPRQLNMSFDPLFDIEL